MAGQPDKRAPVPFPEGPQERLRHYRLDRLVTTLPTLPRVRGDIHFDPAREDVKQFYLQAPVQSLEDLKLWIGLPNDHVDHTRYWQHLRTVAVPPVSARPGNAVLNDLPPQVIADAEHNVLFGFVDEVLLADPFWKAIATRLLERKHVAILHAADLVVDDGQSVTISNTPTAFFNRVTVYGSGSIILRNDCKLIADTVEHLPAAAGPMGIGSGGTHTNP